MSPATGRHFDANYGAVAQLRDGTSVVVRVLRPSDHELVRRGFARLSPRSRYLRFLTAKESLTDEELRDLLTLDGEDRFALGALLRRPGGEEGDGVGIARFARLPGAPAVAEPAITVADDYQGRGLGTLLLQRLVAAARERGVERFACEFSSDNERIWHLVRHGAARAEVVDHGFVRAEVRLPEAGPEDPAGAIDRSSLAYGLLLASARAEIEVRVGGRQE